MTWQPITADFRKPTEECLIMLDNGKVYRYNESKWPKGVPMWYLLVPENPLHREISKPT